jgi:transcriptional regulator with XRE-family HTH domain
MSKQAQNRPPELGRRLLALRKNRRLTLDRLAAASGVSKSMLSQIERGRVNPTVATLWNLTQALGIDIGELLGTATEAGATAGPQLEHLPAHATPTIASADGRCALRILNPPREALTVEWYEMTVEPGGALRSEPHAPGTREHLTVLEGKLLVEVAGSGEALSAGETLRYAADRPHAIVNTEEAPARALLVVEFKYS